MCAWHYLEVVVRVGVEQCLHDLYAVLAGHSLAQELDQERLGDGGVLRIEVSACERAGTSAGV